jgi:hypothetical protein
VCDPASSIVAEAELSDAPPGRTARLVLDLGYADAQVAAVARGLGQGVLSQVEAMLADPATDLPADARDALAALADSPEEADHRSGHRHRVGHAAGAGMASPSGRAGPVRNPA